MIKANRWTIFPPYMFKWNGSRFLKKSGRHQLGGYLQLHDILLCFCELRVESVSCTTAHGNFVPVQGLRMSACMIEPNVQGGWKRWHEDVIFAEKVR